MARRNKRADGEGCIFKRPDGSFGGALSVGGGRRRYVYARTQTEVRQKLEKLKKDLALGICTDPSKETVATYLKRWLAVCAKPNLRDNTYCSYESICRLRITPHLGSVNLMKLTAPAIQALYETLREQGLSPRSVQYTAAVLRKALSQAVKWDLIPRNPADLVDKPKVKKKYEVKILEPHQARAFLEAAQSDRLHALYVLALTTGMRQSELLGVKWQDINLTAGTLAVRRVLQEVNGRLSLADPKSESSRRTISLADSAIIALKAHRKRQAEEKLHSGKAWGAGVDPSFANLVFCATNGAPLRKQNLVRRSYKPLLEAAGVPSVRFHDLRHTAASLMLAAGAPIKVVQEMLGHSQIGITLDIYSHVLPNMQRDAVTKLDALLGGGVE